MAKLIVNAKQQTRIEDNGCCIDLSDLTCFECWDHAGPGDTIEWFGDTFLYQQPRGETYRPKHDEIPSFHQNGASA